MAIGTVCITGCTLFLLYLNLIHDRSKPSTGVGYPLPGGLTFDGSEDGKKKTRWTR